MFRVYLNIVLEIKIYKTISLSEVFLETEFELVQYLN